MTKSNPSGFLFCMLTLFVSGSLLFLMGFFPASQNLIENHGNGSIIYKPTQLDGVNLKVPTAKHEQIILMLIDAWRLDFANTSNMPYATNVACHQLEVKVDIPTVTMPRLKSLTSGTISNFIDVLLNLGHTHQLKDSVLHRLRQKNKTAVFAGDRTWTKLFPKVFKREQPNLDSFFVNDFYKGDKNVTNVMKKELLLKDWNLLVLHYLGLDHIGHVEGSESLKIYKKLLEMDDVVKYITRNETFKKHLLLITGDHGMRNGGGHGGSDKEELYVPLMLFQENCANRKRTYKAPMYSQIDLAPTLAVLLDIDIPQPSLGILISELIEHYSVEEQLYYYLYNAQHLMNKIIGKFSKKYVQQQNYYQWYLEARKAHKYFLLSDTFSPLSFEKAKQNYIRLAKELSGLLSSSLVKFEYDFIAVAIILTSLSALTLLMNTLFDNPYLSAGTTQFSPYKLFKCYMLAAIINYTAHYMNWMQSRGFLHAFLLTIPSTLSLYLLVDIAKLLIQILLPLNQKFRAHFKLTIPALLLTLFLFHTFSLISTSFIEEEHQTWYYLTPTLLVFLTMQNFHNNMKQLWPKCQGEEEKMICYQLWEMRLPILVMLGLIGSRRLNQSGSKWYHLVDLGDILNRQKNAEYLNFLLLFALFLLMALLKKYNTPGQMFGCAAALISVFCYRQSPKHPGITLLVFWSSVVLTFIVQYRELIYQRLGYHHGTRLNLLQVLKTNLTCCLLVCALLHKSHNVILLPTMIFVLETSYQLCDNLYLKDKRAYNRCYVLVLKTVLTIFVANMFYFCQGNTNSLSTIDLNPGYIGLSSYNPFIVGTLITLNMYCAPINAFLCLMCHMFATQIQMLPLRQEKEQPTNSQLLESTEDDLYLVLNVFTVSTVMPVAVYWCVLVNFRYHLFIYSVFAPKAIYECFHILVFYLNFVMTTLYFKMFK